METGPILPLIKIFMVFLAMITGIKFRLGVAVSILAGSLLAGLLFSIPPIDWLKIAVLAVGDPQLIMLALIVALIMILSRITESTGQNQRLMQELSALLKWPRFRLAFFPALIGLLPMPGGAVFSAPMVNSAAAGQNISPIQKILINYWFRHVWELVWPLYPGLILAAHLSGIPLITLLAFTWPGVAVCLIAGWFFYLRSLKTSPAQSTEEPFRTRQAVYYALPLITAIAGSLGLEALLWFIDTGPNPSTGLLMGLLLAIIIAAAQNKITPARAFSLVREKHLWQMIFVILSIFVFKAILDQGGIISQISGVVAGQGALTVASTVLPLLVGLISGITIAFVGSTFPLIIGISEQLGMQSNTAYVVLGLFSGLAGVMVSPIHICFILTCQFFKTNAAAVWPRLIPPCLILFGAGLTYHLFLI